jgi:hypothetical protein
MTPHVTQNDEGPIRRIELEPVDWLIATWRPLQHRTRPEPAPFDWTACADRLDQTGRRSGSYYSLRNWDKASLADAMTPEEARFWLLAMTATTQQTEPSEAACRTELTLADVKKALAGRPHYVPAEVMQPLANLLSPDELLELMLSRDVVPQGRGGPNRPALLWMQSRLILGFRRHVLPYLGPDVVGRLRERVRPGVEPRTWAGPGFPGKDDWPMEYLLCPLLGLHAELLQLVSAWPDDMFVARNGRSSQEVWSRYPREIVFGLGDARLVAHHTRRLRLPLLQPEHVRAWLAHTECGALDFVRDSILAQRKKGGIDRLLEVFCRVKAPEAAPHMLELRLHARSPRLARRWLEAETEHAVAGLLPLAVGRSKLGAAALEYLRDARRQGFTAVVEHQVSRAAPEVADRVRRLVLDAADPVYRPLNDESAPDWLRLALQGIGKERGDALPEWANVGRLPPLVVGDRCLSETQTRAVVTALKRNAEVTGAVVGALKAHLDRQALVAFGWRLFELWRDDGAPPGDRWVLSALGRLGSDETALALSPLIHNWPGDTQHQRAQTALDCLSLIGTDTALLQLANVAQTHRIPRVRTRARKCLEDCAGERGLTLPELEDRVVPDLGLDASGGRVFDYGARRFRLAIRPDLTLCLRDEGGKVRASLPRAGVRDDRGKAGAAAREWALMKKQLHEVVKDQALRLEQAMVSGRRWSLDDFDTLFVRHPLRGHIVRQLLWGGYDDAGRLVRTFRVGEERTLLNVDHTPCSMEGVAAIGVVHPVHLGAEERTAWGEVWSDFEIIAPFPQLGRRVHTLAPGEESATEVARFRGPKVMALALGGFLKNQGWTRGYLRGRSYGESHVKVFAGANISAVLRHDTVGGTRYPHHKAEQELTSCFFVTGAWEPRHGAIDPAKAVPLGTIDPVVSSEIIDNLTVLAAKNPPHSHNFVVRPVPLVRIPW